MTLGNAMEFNQNPAVVGVWTDHGTGESLLSVQSPWGIIIVALAGIWLSLSTKYVKKILANIALWIHLRSRKQPQHVQISRDPTESTSLLSSSSRGSAKDEQILAKLLKEEHHYGIRDLFAKSFFSNDLTTADKLRLGVFTSFVAMAAAGVIIGGYFSANIRADGPNLLASQKCGLWLFEGRKRSDAATRARMLGLEKEERAAQFAEDCYGPSGSIASRCQMLYKPKLPVSDAIYDWTGCPFQNDICLQNLTVTFKTPLIDAQDLGINSLSTPKFRRSNACTPLKMDYPYIRNQTENGTTIFTYHYGSKRSNGNHTEYTYKTVGDPWDRLAPVYDVFAYSSNADDSDHPVWKPHRFLAPPRYSTVTIVFVSSLRILYSEQRSDDPIFPADKEWYIPGDPRPWFRNSDPRARPFACVNTIEVCTADESHCWNFNEPTQNGTVVDNTPEYILLYSALYETDIYYSLAKRQGRALLAQKKVSQYFSTALGSDPWVAEVQNLVWTALARTSINAWSVASGEDSIHEGKDGFTEKTKGYGDLCKKYKYRPRNYQSLRWVPLSLLPWFLVIIWILSLDWAPVERQGSKAVDRLRNAFRHAILHVRAQEIRARQNSNGLATIQPALYTNDPLATTTPSQHRDPGEDGTSTFPQTNTSAAHVGSMMTLPISNVVTIEAEQTTSSDAEASVITTTQSRRHNSYGQNTDRRNDSTLVTEASGFSGEIEIEWEPLVWHKLLYALGWLAISSLILAAKAIWLPMEFLFRKFSLDVLYQPKQT